MPIENYYTLVLNTFCSMQIGCPTSAWDYAYTYTAYALYFVIFQFSYAPLEKCPQA